METETKKEWYFEHQKLVKNHLNNSYDDYKMVSQEVSKDKVFEIYACRKKVFDRIDNCKAVYDEYTVIYVIDKQNDIGVFVNTEYMVLR